MNTLTVRQLGLQPYQEVWYAMKDFTDSRTESTKDELWLVEHPPVFTLGQQGKKEHILQISDIPIIETDRGGQVTYHGPGQLVAYPLLNIRRRKLGVRQLVTLIENILIQLLANYDIQAQARPDAPGVYVDSKKVASLGLRIRKGCSYHGLALNIDMDLTPFSFINPCGMAGMQMAQIKDFVPSISFDEVSEKLVTLMNESLNC